MGRETNLHFTLFLRLLLLLGLCWGQRSNPDPERPSCHSCDLRLSCNCSHDGFTRVPMVTDRALTLDLSFNNITVVNDDDLTGHMQLRALSLHGNALSYEEIDGDAANYRTARPLSLCLHKRDFLPGQWIVDNIMSAIERSRRTVFILSENFVQSDWCRYELDFSHFWLFDGEAGGEPAILILLEPLSKDDVPKRFCKLRKLMSSTTYLEWPQEEERRGEFWRSLRNALGGEGDWDE